jgi:tetratricopeptide (TPR) repeat protein
MSWTKLTLTLFLLIPASWTRVSRLNTAIDQAENAYLKTEYQASIVKHQVLIDEFQYNSPALEFDIGLSNQFAEKVDEAAGYFDKASISSDKPLASFAFNQGGVLVGNKKEYEAALSKFKSALIKDPSNEVARHNFELLSRWMNRDEDRKNENDKKPDPSDFAKRQKAEADRMVEQFRFKDALSLMNAALQQDETVAAYQDFITSLTDITAIDEK